MELALTRSVKTNRSTIAELTNTDENTEGCLLPGKTRQADFVGSSRAAFTTLFDKIKVAIQREKVFITVQ